MKTSFDIQFNKPSTRKFFNGALGELAKQGIRADWAINFLERVYLESCLDTNEDKNE